MPIRNPSLIETLDEGVSQGFITKLDFTGAGVTASVSSFQATVNIPGGAGASWILVEANLGNAAWRGRFTVVDASVNPTSNIIIQQAPGPYTGKGTLADEAEMDPLWCVAVPGSGQFTVHWRTFTMMGVNFSDIRGTQPVSAANTQHGKPFLASLQSVILGRVKGNVKFLYTVT